MKKITMEEVRKHKNQNSVWIVIHNDVYDVTKYLNEHPGGTDPLLESAGKDSTQAFEDIGHSDDARELMKKFKIGTLSESDRKHTSVPCSNLKWALLALAGAIIVGVVLRKYLAST